MKAWPLPTMDPCVTLMVRWSFSPFTPEVRSHQKVSVWETP